MKKQIGLKTAVALMLLASALTCVLLLGGLWLYFGGGLLSDIRTYAALRRDIGEYYIGDYKDSDVTEAALSATVTALGDKWSYYMSPEDYQKYINSSNNQYSGLGISVKTDDATGGILVVSVYAGSSASAAGIVAGDIITAIDGKDITKLALSDATALVDRQIGQTVRLTVLGTDGKTREVSAEYALIDTNPVSYKLLEGAIGYIAIRNFDGGAAEEFIKAADDLVGKGATSFIFDVRNDGGGKVSELKKILDYLLPECDIFVSVEKDGKEDVSRSDADNVKLPAVVLVNSYTYSAAEYFAAALQEYQYATVVGQHTTGKNRSQITLELPDGGALHISSGEYLTPRRVSLTKQGGIAPDKDVALSDSDNVLLYNGQLDSAGDTQLNAAIQLLDKA
ncbi:carboxyl-terminal processing protease [Sporobacter termitidis DSM 10068]|uniref:Carboxyl-terminal processing protease n=1 Tax=Sporobacter termitidis DSM 10068 TaxID=1123282 RepID=A0A1M5ULM4_9FIRM|nr:S41 family peptidase [Sporobacter termitidis]SHH63905.1 carboxyl-terminal processing protease [Sporobacter termitidis DSM 10068]